MLAMGRRRLIFAMKTLLIAVEIFCIFLSAVLILFGILSLLNLAYISANPIEECVREVLLSALSVPLILFGLYLDRLVPLLIERRRIKYH